MSGNNVTLTEQGHLVVGNVGIPAAVVPAIEAHYRAKFAAERMPEDVQKLVGEMRRSADSQRRQQPRPGEWAADHGWTARADLLDCAIAALEAAYSQNAEQVWEYQCRLPGNAWTDVSAWHRCQGERRRRVAAGPWQSVEEGAVDEPR